MKTKFQTFVRLVTRASSVIFNLIYLFFVGLLVGLMVVPLVLLAYLSLKVLIFLIL